MKRAAPFVLMGAMAAVIVLLLLNLRERRRYKYEGSRTPLPVECDEPPPSWLPPAREHPCPKCGTCVHRLGAVRQERTLTLREHHGWYRLFWAGDAVRHYSDGVLLAVDMWNENSRGPAGEWTLEFSYPPPHESLRECETVAAPTRLAFRLAVSDSEPSPSVLRRLPNGLEVPNPASWFTYRYERKHDETLRRFFWQASD